MEHANHTSPVRAGQPYKRVAMGAIVFGTVALVVASQVGLYLGGLVVYALAALLGFGLLTFVRMNDSLALADERQSELERRASNATVQLVGAVGWVVLVGIALLDAAGKRPMSPTEQTLLSAFAGLFLTWGAIYLLFRFRR